MSFIHLYYFKKLYDVWAAEKSLQYFRFTIDFFSSDRLQDFSNTSYVVGQINALVDLRVLSSTKLLLNLIVACNTQLDFVLLIKGVILRSFRANLLVGALKYFGFSFS